MRAEHNSKKGTQDKLQAKSHSASTPPVLYKDVGFLSDLMQQELQCSNESNMEKHPNTNRTTSQSEHFVFDSFFKTLVKICWVQLELLPSQSALCLF